MLRRLYHVSCVLNNIKKQGIKLNKMLNPKVKRKSQHSYYDVLPSTKSLVRSAREPAKRAVRRIAVLNKLFMKYITDIMSTGSLALDVLGRGIEISKVKITPDFEMLNVYWVCKGTLSDIQTEQILNRTAGPLRHELSSLRLMGEVPYIVFIKDEQEALIYDLDRRLALADYGEGYTPTEVGHLLKSEFILDTKLSSEMKAKIKQVEDSTASEEVPVPEMTHEVFGLDHAKTMSRLLAARKRSSDAWDRVHEEGAVISYRASALNSDVTDHVAQKQELADFLLQRQVLENKIHKELRSNKAERDILMNMEQNNDDYIDEPDYYDDDDDFTDDEDITDVDSNQTSTDNR